jgi:hypothetical protein
MLKADDARKLVTTIGEAVRLLRYSPKETIAATAVLVLLVLDWAFHDAELPPPLDRR